MICSLRRTVVLLFVVCLTVMGIVERSAAVADDPVPVITPERLVEAGAFGLERTGASQERVTVSDAPGGGNWKQALRVTLTEPHQETNATQVIVPTIAPVAAGDALTAEMYVRGAKTDGTPAQVELLFEQSTLPWTKSVARMVTAVPGKPAEWKRVAFVFSAGGDYAPGAAVTSIRLAFGKQTVELGGLKIVNYGKGISIDELAQRVAASAPPVAVTVRLDPKQLRQTITGFGGNYAIARFGTGPAIDSVGEYLWTSLRPAHLRFGIPLKTFLLPNGSYAPEQETVVQVYRLMQRAQKQGIPFVASAWDVPDYCVENPGDFQQRRTRPEQRQKIADALTEWVRVARTKYNVQIAYISFNEPNWGASVVVPPDEMAFYVRTTGAAMAKAGLTTKWLVGDTTSGEALPAYAAPLLADKTLAPYLGPLSFHGWDALGATEAQYRAIAELGRKHNKPVWCLESGYDAGLWAVKPPVWNTWNNALLLSRAYARTLNLSGASVLDYWQYANDYPLSGGADGRDPFTGFHAIKLFSEALPPGARVLATNSDTEEVALVAAIRPAGRLSLVVVNTGGMAKVTITGAPGGAKGYRKQEWTRDATKAAGRMQTAPLIVSAGGGISLTVPARSVVVVESQ